MLRREVLTRAALQLLFPRRCPFCGRVLGLLPRCEECAAERRELEHFPSRRLDPECHWLEPLAGAAAVYRYDGIVKTAIQKAKYSGAAWAVEEMGCCMAEKLFAIPVRRWMGVPQLRPDQIWHLDYDLVIPVPDGGRNRGYNVPTLLARPLAQAMDLPLREDILMRRPGSKHQASLSMVERWFNMAGAVTVRDGVDVEDKRVLLVDDVITTGATVSACARALRSAGAESVFAVSLASREIEGRRIGRDVAITPEMIAQHYIDAERVPKGSQTRKRRKTAP